MFARLWWKEAWQTGPVWGFLAVAGMAIQSYLFCYWRAQMSPGGYAQVGLIVTMVYLFLVAAAVFAGERENGTLWILDAMPAGRLQVWSAKASFTLATTLALGVLMWLGVLTFGRSPTEWGEAGLVAVVWWATALGWGLLWSAVLANAIQAALLAMASFGLTLLLLRVNLQGGPTLEAAPALLALAALTTGASAWAFWAGGPPGRPPRRPRPAARAVPPAAPAPGGDATIGRSTRIGTVAVPRLLWETLRQVRTELGTLVGLAIAAAVAPYLIHWNANYSTDVTPFTVLGLATLGLSTGVLAFNGENRGRTHRFLLHHGVRPRLVWAVKVGVWWATSLVLWSITFAAAWPTLTRLPRGPVGLADGGRVVAWGVGGLSIAFAIAVICGMAFRRGIVAGVIAVVATLAIAIPLVALSFAQLTFPWHWPYIAAGFLAVSWAWSGDWLHDGPGWGRWARLALYTAAVPLLLAPIYVAGRVWGVPALSPEQSEAFLRRRRVLGPVPQEDNAAMLYAEANRLISRNSYPLIEPTPAEAEAEASAGAGMAIGAGMAAGAPGTSYRRVPDWATDLRLLDRVSFDPPPAGVTTWLEALEPALELFRAGARKPHCRYVDLRTATEFDRNAGEPPLRNLILPAAVSARVRIARGDLDGAWAEVEALQRLSRQYSDSSPLSAQVVDPVADGLAFRWAADPRQTVATLERAARAWKELPPGASAGDRARVDAALFRNLLDLPREKLIEKIRDGSADIKRKVTVVEQLRNDVQATSWEVARAARVADLLAVARIQQFETSPRPFLAEASGRSDRRRWWSNPLVAPDRGLLVRGDGPTISLSPEELDTLASTTPLIRYLSLGGDLSLQDRGRMNRRAIWLTLLLRLDQARHGGKLPRSLDELLARPGGSDDLVASREDLIDPYSGKPFGFVASQGQPLLPIGVTDPLALNYAGRADPRLQPAEGCRLLYSQGPDGDNGRAERNVGLDLKGDFIFPLKDDVKPPGAESR